MKCNKKWVLLVAVALAVCVLCVGLAGCDDQNKPNGSSKVIEDKLDKASDLVFLKINNCTADWIDDNNLSVKVPNTSKLSLTDFILSPGAKGNVYTDAKYTQEVKDIKDIDMTADEVELYIKVSHNALSKDYKVKVARSSYGECIDNRGGHQYIPEGVDKVTIEGVEYNVIRDYYEYAELNYVKVKENYILANDIEYDPYYSVNEVYIGVFDCIFDGNNYALSWKQHLPFFDSVRGTIKNIILEAKYNTMVTNDRGAVLVYFNSGDIYNCVNKNDYEYKTAVFSVFSRDHEYNDNKIYGCINYGDIEGGGIATGIGVADTISHCVNVGDIESSDPIDIWWDSVAVGISDTVRNIDRCANLGEIKALNACGIATIDGESTGLRGYLTNCKNYGRIRGGDVGAGIGTVQAEYKKEYIKEGSITFDNNFNYGKVSGKYAYDITSPYKKVNEYKPII